MSDVKAMPESSRLPLVISTIEANWQEEMQGSATYRTLAERESDPTRQAILQHMAESEEAHARRWEARLHELGAETPQFRGAATGQVDSIANTLGGPNATLRRIELDERQHIAEYGRQLKELQDEPSIAILQDLIDDERRHSKMLKAMEAPEQGHRSGIDRLRPREASQALAELRARRGRKTPASWVGDAIYGVNDGLGAIFGIVSGVSGATAGNSHYVLLAGLAGMIASALSMGSGAYLAAKSEREIYEAELARKRREIEEHPEEGREELALVYQVKGLPDADARRIADHLSADPEQFLRTLAAEELNLTEEALSNPITAALSGAFSTAIGAFVPILPFFFMHGTSAVIAAAVVSLAAHFAVGAAKTLITVRSWWSSGLEMTIVGAVEGVATYLIGIWLGHLGA
ncbi:MAG: VIT1/CCC1 transporter family protein [Capsulimonadaceae bacterium]